MKAAQAGRGLPRVLGSQAAGRCGQDGAGTAGGALHSASWHAGGHRADEQDVVGAALAAPAGLQQNRQAGRQTGRQAGRRQQHGRQCGVQQGAPPWPYA